MMKLRHRVILKYFRYILLLRHLEFFTFALLRDFKKIFEISFQVQLGYHFCFLLVEQLAVIQQRPWSN